MLMYPSTANWVPAAMREPDGHCEGLNYAQRSLKICIDKKTFSNAESRPLRLEQDKKHFYFVESAAL